MKLEELYLKKLNAVGLIYHYQSTDWGEEIVMMKDDGLAMCKVYVFSERENEIYVEGLSVDPQIRKSGIGTNLIKTCHLIAEESNRENIYLFALRGSWMYMWYAKMGYTFHSANHNMPGYDWLKLFLPKSV